MSAADDALCNPVGLVMDFEGWSAVPYRDIAGHWTIGYGHLMADDEPRTEITREEGRALLRADLAAATHAVRKLVTVHISACQEAALVSFTFNEGIEAFTESTLLRMLNKGNLRGAAKQFPRWNKYRDPETHKLVVSKGLTKRRAKEREIFVNGSA